MLPPLPPLEEVVDGTGTGVAPTRLQEECYCTASPNCDSTFNKRATGSSQSQKLATVMSGMNKWRVKAFHYLWGRY